jgi:hypothetical protein
VFEGEAPLTWIGQVGGWGGMVALTALLWWALASGRLLTKTQHETVVSLQNATIDRQEKTIETLQGQNEKLLEGNRTAKDFFEKVPVEERATRGDQT